MNLVLDRCQVSREAIPTEIAEMAASELTILRNNIGSYNDLVENNIVFDSPAYAPYINFAVNTPRQISEIYKAAPTVVSILDELGDADQKGGYLGFFPGRFTVNFALPGQIVSRHKDAGNEDRPRQASVVTLRGLGSFTLDPDSPNRVDINDLGPGDVHSFHNPAQKVDRPLHYATNTGNTARITLGYQI